MKFPQIHEHNVLLMVYYIKHNMSMGNHITRVDNNVFLQNIESQRKHEETLDENRS